MLAHRPLHLRQRPVTSRQFAESATLIRTAGHRSADNGRWIAGAATETPVMVSAAPVAADNARVREALPDGQRHKEALQFWLAGVDVNTLVSGTAGTRGDQLRYPAADGPLYRVVALSRWHGITSCIGVRADGS